MTFWEAIWDRIFWTVFLLIVVALALAFMAFDFFFELFFPAQFDELCNRFFSAQAGDAIVSFRAFKKEHPIIGTVLQWGLLMFGM